MKPARIFQQYIWIVNTLRKQRLTLKELSDKWVDDEVADGNPLPRSSFNKYRDGILDMFGLVIDCDSTHHEARGVRNGAYEKSFNDFV